MGATLTPHWLKPLERHSQRRMQGIPTVTLLAGSNGVQEWVWSKWQAARGARTRVVSACQSDEVLEQWLRGREFADGVRGGMIAALAKCHGVPINEFESRLLGRSPSQLEALAQQVAVEMSFDLDLVRWALGVDGDRSALGRCTVSSLASVAALHGSLPALMLRPDPVSVEALTDAAQTLFQIAESVPNSELALAVDESSLGSLRAALPNRLLTVLMEGLVVLRALGSNHGGDADSASTKLEYDAAQFARSRAELALFQLLDTRPRTRGLFALNRKLAESPEGTALEIDLLCEDLRLAVEVDGYHHFRDAGSYRRDRRKDVVLQGLGYCVVRVLANDIEHELEYVLDVIDGAVERRRSQGFT